MTDTNSHISTTSGECRGSTYHRHGYPVAGGPLTGPLAGPLAGPAANEGQQNQQKSKTNSPHGVEDEYQVKLPTRVVSFGMEEKEQRKLMVDAAEKEEEERQAKLSIRVDVVYHFFCYRYFDRTTACLEMLNFTDSDVDIFNLTCNKTRGLDNWHICAEYMNKVGNVTPKTNTHRRRFIHKVRSFNKTQPSHFRFHLQNLTQDDVAYIRDLGAEDKRDVKDQDPKKTALMWSSSMVEDEVPVASDCYHSSGYHCDPIELAISESLFRRKEMLRSKANLKGFDAEETLHTHVTGMETAHNPFPETLEELATDSMQKKKAATDTE